MATLQRTDQNFVAARIGIDNITEIRYTLRFLGVPIKGPAHTCEPTTRQCRKERRQRRHHRLNCHRVRGTQAASIDRSIHMDGRQNPAEIILARKMILTAVTRSLARKLGTSQAFQLLRCRPMPNSSCKQDALQR